MSTGTEEKKQWSLVSTYTSEGRITVATTPKRVVRVIQPSVTPDNDWVFSLFAAGQLDTRRVCELVLDPNAHGLWNFIPLPGNTGNVHRAKLLNCVMQRFDSKCAKCGRANVKFHLDHHHPKSKGGYLTPRNTVLLCQRCNIVKKARLPAEFYNPDELRRIEGVLANA